MYNRTVPEIMPDVLTLRKYYAIKMMPVYFGKLASRFDKVTEYEYEAAAKLCFMCADAMLKIDNGI